MVMMVETDTLSVSQSSINNDNDNTKKIPVIKATLDKNKSQRMGDFRLK
jgi:hypothetical protein